MIREWAFRAWIKAYALMTKSGALMTVVGYGITRDLHHA